MQTTTRVLASLLVAGGVAYAAPAAAQLYLGAGFGPSDADDDVVAGLIDTGVADTTDTGAKAFAGFQVHPNFAIEASYVDLGEVTYEGMFGGSAVTDGRVELTGVGLAPVARVPITPAFDVFAKAGLFVWEAEFRDVTGGVPMSGKEDGTDIFFGAGMSYAFTRHLLGRAEYEHFELEEVGASLLSFSLVFRF